MTLSPRPTSVVVTGLVTNLAGCAAERIVVRMNTGFDPDLESIVRFIGIEEQA